MTSLVYIYNFLFPKNVPKKRSQKCEKSPKTFPKTWFLLLGILQIVFWENQVIEKHWFYSVFGYVNCISWFPKIVPKNEHYKNTMSKGNPLYPLEDKSLYPPLHPTKVGLCPNLEPINKDLVTIFVLFCYNYFVCSYVCSYMKVIHT